MCSGPMDLSATESQRCSVSPKRIVGANVGSTMGSAKFIVQKQQDKVLDW